MLFLIIFFSLFLSSVPVHGNEVAREKSPHNGTLFMADGTSINKLIQSNNELIVLLKQKDNLIEKLQEEEKNLKKRITNYRWATFALTLTTAGFFAREVAGKYPGLFPGLGKFFANLIHKAYAC